MKNPTIISAGAVANPGIARKIGDKNRETKNINPVVIAVRPVFPPSATPALDSTKLVMVEVPIIEPATVPTASAISTRPTRGSLPSLSRRFALSATPITVPIVSNISTNKNENTIITNCDKFSPIQPKSNLKNVGAMDFGIKEDAVKDGIKERAPASGSTTYHPIISAPIPKTQVMRIPHKIYPFTWKWYMIAVINTPIKHNATPGSEKSPNFTRVESSFTTMPEP